MNVKSLEVFKTLAETLSFSKTAERCYLSPSAVTRVIQKLEESYEASFFERNNRNVSLTDAGRYMYDFSIKVLDANDELFALLHPDEDNLRGDIRLFCTVTASYVILPRIIEALNARYPNVQLQLETGSMQNALNLVASNQMDAGISFIDEHKLDDNLYAHPVLITSMVLVVSKDSDVQSIDQALAQYPFIMPIQFLNDNTIDTWLIRQKKSPRIYGEVDGNEAILSLVASGVGVSVLPRVVVEHNHLASKIKMLNIADMTAVTVGIVMRKQSLKSPVKLKFWQLCQSLALLDYH
ncbi:MULTISPECIES: LysR substrate-binding domain-containing protein [Cysteiniphilum]|uniref:LysR substrate-binding domain-containing protein n=1 Tax=Cysteiniphilum TaxID=2056696 RepID=UPI00177A9E66|nr:MULTISPECIES: LysR substrate-binding domain-containing protein [Cysteiniphilum]